jgi:hypothetical protein
MILAAAILDWTLFVTILGFGAVQGYRSGRVTRLGVFLIWFLLPLHAGVFSAFASSLPQPARHNWSNAFPEGTHVLAFIAGGWCAGIMMCGLGILIRRIVRGEQLFQDPGSRQDG